jgi:hypothetical protein
MELDQGRVRRWLCDYSYQIPGSKQAEEFLDKMVDYKIITYFCFTKLPVILGCRSWIFQKMLIKPSRAFPSLTLSIPN